MADKIKVYVENDSIVFEKSFSWEQIVEIAQREDVVAETLDSDKVSKALLDCLQDDLDLGDLFSDYLESSALEK